MVVELVLVDDDEVEVLVLLGLLRLCTVENLAQHSW